MNTLQYTTNIHKNRETDECLTSFRAKPMKHCVICEAVIAPKPGPATQNALSSPCFLVVLWTLRL